MSRFFSKAMLLCMFVMSLFLSVFFLSISSHAQNGEILPERFDYKIVFEEPERFFPNHAKHAPERVVEKNKKVENAIYPWANVVVQSFRDDRWDIFMSDDNGGRLSSVTHDERADIHPSLRRDGGFISYSTRFGEQFDLLAVNLTNGEQQRLTDTSWDEVYSRWSPDGSMILFQGYEFDQADVFVINADGSNKRRLTSHEGFDGMPTWSPDGTKIAFVSDRSGGLRIHSMDADGNNVVQLNDQPFSLRPKWSPDGSLIAFDADPDLRGFQSLFVMNADGSGNRLIEQSHGDIDHLANAWTPDGGAILYNIVYYTLYQGQFYISSNRFDLHAINYDGSSINIPGAYNFNADWQSLDNIAPNINIGAMEPTQPSNFSVAINYGDEGGSGFDTWDFQYRKNGSSSWITLKENGTGERVVIEGGQAGDTYEFRVRGIDHALNESGWNQTPSLISIETIPPVLENFSQTAYAKVDTPIYVTWDGEDPGLSGVSHYDVQVKKNNGEWESLSSNIKENYISYIPEEVGASYQFRARGTDFAGNQSNWFEPSSSSKATYWVAENSIFDNTHTPLSSAQVDAGVVESALFYPGQSNEVQTHILTSTNPISLTWSKDGFGALGPTAFTSGSFVDNDVILPPADNLILNGSFENGLSDWGVSAPNLVITTADNHSSQHVAASFRPTYELARSKVFTDSTITIVSSPTIFQPVDDFNGKSYYISLETENLNQNDSDQILTIWETTDGDPRIRQFNQYTFPFLEELPSQYIHIESVIIKPDSSIHLIYMQHSLYGDNWDLYYLHFNEMEGWQSSKLISSPDGTVIWPEAVKEDSEGGIHVFWKRNQGEDAPGYNYRSPDGVWSHPTIFLTGDVRNFGFQKIILDENDRLTVIMETSVDYSNNDQIYYAVKESPRASWSEPQPIIDGEPKRSWQGPYGFEGPNQTLHFFWQEIEGDQELKHVIAYPNGGLKQAPAPPFIPTQGVLDQEGKIHFIGVDLEVFNWSYVTYSFDGSWSPLTAADVEGSLRPIMWLDPYGTIHNVYSDSSSYSLLGYQYRRPNQEWSPFMEIYDRDGSTPRLDFYVNSMQQPMFYWNDWDDLGFYASYQRQMQQNTQSSLNVLTQTVTVPITMSNPVLSYRFKAVGLSDENTFDITVSSTSKEMTKVINTSTGSWEQDWMLLDDFAGEEIEISFHHNQVEGMLNSWLKLDDVSLGSAYPDVRLTDQAVNVLKGKQLLLDIPIENLSGIASDEVSLQLTLPDGVEFKSASTEPQVQGNQLIWTFPTILPKDKESIRLVLEASGGLSIGDQLKIDLVLETNDEEVDSANNSAEVVIDVSPFIGLLPFVHR